MFENPPLPLDLPNYFFNKFNPPKLIVNSFKKSESIKRIYDYGDLKKYGYVINSYKASKKFFKGQHRLYKLEKISKEGENTVKRIPDDHKVFFDTINKAFLLQGRSSENRWVYEIRLKMTNPKLKEEISWDDKIKLAMGYEVEPEDKNNVLEIEGIPVAISSEEHKLVCLPPWKDPPVIGFVGRRGGSKSIGQHALNDLLFNMGNCCCLLNDWKRETNTWNMPTDGSEFITRLNQVGLNPKPLPTVYFCPESRIKNKESILIGSNEGIGNVMSLSFKKIISDYNNFFSGFEEFKLGKSKTVFDFKSIEKCNSREEVLSLLDQNNFSKDKRPMIGKVERTMEFLFDQEVCDINTKSPSSYVVEELKGEKVFSRTEKLNPIIASMVAGLYPVFLPKSLLTIQFGRTSILPSYMNHLIQDIYNVKDETDYFKDKEIHIGIDELTTITSKGANQAIMDVANLGRSFGIGMNWSAQLYTKVLDEVKDNTNYIFCMQYASKQQINAVCGDCDTKELIKEDIRELSREIPNECVIFPKSSPLLVYDLSTGEKELLDEPIKGQLIPPMSRHKKPNE